MCVSDSDVYSLMFTLVCSKKKCKHLWTECAYKYFFYQFVCCGCAKETHCLVLLPNVSLIVIIRIHLAFCPREHPRECKLPILVLICTAITEHTRVVYLARVAW